MKHIFAALCALSLAGAPVLAQSTDTEVEEGFDLMEEGAQLLLRGLLNEMQPAMDDFRALAEEYGPVLNLLAKEMGPALKELFETVDDFGYYDPPELLPNGDIIMRRRADAPAYVPPEGNEIDL